MSKTRMRILEAAVEVFGRLGYATATVREICDQAEVNLAAVNYHFQGKEGLYRAVACDLLSKAFAQFPVAVADDTAASPEKRLRTFVLATLQRLLAPGGLSGDSGKGQFVARELADPSPVLDQLVDAFIRPTANVLGEIVAELLGPAASSQDVLKCQLSVIGQCFHYAMARPVITRLTGLDFTEESLIEELADHVTRFSLAALAGVRDSIEQQSDGPAEGGRARES
jgi:TetR/AcrR family transcriptional regulator, regulator of cefoperazone and chloramphenicol sensitivity